MLFGFLGNRLLVIAVKLGELSCCNVSSFISRRDGVHFLGFFKNLANMKVLLNLANMKVLKIPNEVDNRRTNSNWDLLSRSLLTYVFSD